jgi:predicted AlkP superfamily pyrophosphatase or phosphodiesterase
MTRRTRFVPLLIVLILLLMRLPARTQSGQAPTGPAQRSTPTQSRHIVVISLDGFPSWALDDPYLPVPTLRGLVARGAVARTMKPVNPSVTWPNHTSLVTGVTPARHGVLFNGILLREPGVPPRVEPWRDKSEMVRGKTLYDLAYERGMTTAQVDWVAIQNAPTITWSFPERPDPKGQVAQDLVKAGLISESDLETFHTRNIVWRDHIWTEAAAHIIRTHRPNLLLFHLLNLDSTHHRYGPRTHAGMTTMALLDAHVARILASIEQAGLTSGTTVFVVSDHGFKTVKRQIRLNARFAQAGLLKAQDGKIVASDVYAVPEGGTAIVYVTVPDASGEILARAKRVVESVEGVDTIVEPADYGRYGLPQPADNPQMGALFVIPRDGYAFTAAVGDQIVVDATEGSFGAHGYVSSDPELGALFIASGAGIAPGSRLETIDNVDVAPTIAKLLGLTLPDAQGRVLTEILSPAPQR